MELLWASQVTQLVKKKKDSKSKLVTSKSKSPAHVGLFLSLYGVLNNHLFTLPF